MARKQTVKMFDRTRKSIDGKPLLTLASNQWKQHDLAELAAKFGKSWLPDGRGSDSEKIEERLRAY